MGVIKKFPSLRARFCVGGGLLVPSPAALSGGSLGFFRAFGNASAWTSRQCSNQVASAHEIVGRRSPSKHPRHMPPTAVPHLAHESHRLHPAENFFDPCPLFLAERVAGMARGSPIEGTRSVRVVLRHMRRGAGGPDLLHPVRGVQYAGAEYVAILKQHGMIPSMSRPANPYDNACCESFIKTLKLGEIYARRYDNLEHLRANIEEFIEEYYNLQRLHSALGHRPPEEFEQQSKSPSSAPDFRSATMQFLQNDGNQTRVSKVLTGEGDSIAVPFPRPHPLLTDTGKAQ
jgi:integrase-like protein